MDELTTYEDLRSELFSARTDLDAARADERRYLWYMLLGGSPGMLLALSAVLWDQGPALGLIGLLLALWFMIRWTAAGRRTHALELHMRELQQARDRLEAAHPNRGIDAPDSPSAVPDVLPSLEQ